MALMFPTDTKIPTVTQDLSFEFSYYSTGHFSRSDNASTFNSKMNYPLRAPNPNMVPDI